jgi:hypothetical protein
MSTERVGSLPYVIATSSMAHLRGWRRYHPLDTIEYAERVGADGVQLHTSQARLADPIMVYDALGAANLTHNIAHLNLGTVLTSNSFKDDGVQLLRTASRMVPPFPGVGKICVIHHDGASTESPRKIAEMTKRVLGEAQEQIDQPVVFGLECTPLGGDGPLAVQVGRYVDVFDRLVEEEIPVFSVIDARNLNDRSLGTRFTDTDNKHLKELCELSAGRPAIIHARDVRRIDDSDRPGNAVPLGTGEFAPVYRELSRLGEVHGVDWLALVDESQEPVLKRRPDINDIDRALERLGLRQPQEAASGVLVG